LGCISSSNCWKRRAVPLLWKLFQDDALGVDNSSQAPRMACVVTRQAVVSPRVRLMGAVCAPATAEPPSTRGPGLRTLALCTGHLKEAKERRSAGILFLYC
jgi:hypothetical protein